MTSRQRADEMVFQNEAQRELARLQAAYNAKVREALKAFKADGERWHGTDLRRVSR